MTNAPRISIIATFYNLENSVEYCLNSIFAQDYPNYEVICVDDGSTDHTFEKLIQFSIDHDIRILRQSNSGPSSARNTGIRHSQGKLISFVDGDDIVSPFYLSSLVRAIENTNSDFATGTIDFIPDEALKASEITWNKPSDIKVFDEKRAAEMLLCHKLGVSGCGKLVPRTFYHNHFFPEGHFHEDLRTSVDLFNQASRIALVEEPIYKYIQRPGSNMHGFVNLDQRSADLILAIDHITQICREMGVNESYIELYRCLACLRLHNNGGKYIDSKALRDYVRKHLRSALSCKDALPADRLTLRLFAFGILPYDFIRSIKLKIKPNL